MYTAVIEHKKYIESYRDPYANMLWPRNKMNSYRSGQTTTRSRMTSYVYTQYELSV
jgi:hypothetical protein